MVAALALAGGACGGDDDGDTTGDAADTADTSDAASTDDADSGDEDSGDDGGSETNAWCALMEGAETPAFDELDITDADSVENAFREVVDLIEEAADSAPDEIEDDVQILADQFETFFDELEEADFNFAEIDQTALDSPEADAASERIDEFCGLEPDAGETVTTDDAAAPDDTGAAPAGGDGTVEAELMRQFTAIGMTEDQASCMVDNLDMEEVVANGATDPMMFLDLFETCDINMAELQPPGG
jgi:hypothetical protein